jgi:hypothetical protein
MTATHTTIDAASEAAWQQHSAIMYALKTEYGIALRAAQTQAAKDAIHHTYGIARSAALANYLHEVEVRIPAMFKTEAASLLGV